MKVVILGASGGCGRELVAQAIGRGHTVTAVIRPSSGYAPPPAVTLVKGEIFDGALLRETFAGQDVVLSGLGLRLPGFSPFAKPEVPDLLSRSSPIIVEAMRAAGVGRLLAISAGGVGDSYAIMPGVFKLLIKLTALRKAYAELEVMERVFLSSGLDVCCCRPTGLSDEPATGEAKVARALTGRAMIPRADVAWWMLDAIEAPRFVETSPVITVTGIA